MKSPTVSSSSCRTVHRPLPAPTCSSMRAGQSPTHGTSSVAFQDPSFPGPGGMRFRFFTFMPTQKCSDHTDHAPALLENVQGGGLSNFVEAFDPERPGMHISDTIDFVHILSGEIVLELERREIRV